MSQVIKAIAKQYMSLPANCPERLKAYGVVYNNTEVGGVRLSSHPSGKRVAGLVLDELGYAPYVPKDQQDRTVYIDADINSL